MQKPKSDEKFASTEAETRRSSANWQVAIIVIIGVFIMIWGLERGAKFLLTPRQMPGCGPPNDCDPAVTIDIQKLAPPSTIKK
jgi:hypothetical protein